ncbi:translation initiation factor IF-2-like [Scyliorhinus canicula]|uniref:translation initiation factor IF-2-like n=1 Tax=Scyliorhinus canicula TaxID=7830 RepID=UPI0018F6A1BC|nr:translation initiation factor IF-2-like [Scyliorhinus canicula]
MRAKGTQTISPIFVSSKQGLNILRGPWRPFDPTRPDLRDLEEDQAQSGSEAPTSICSQPGPRSSKPGLATDANPRIARPSPRSFRPNPRRQDLAQRDPERPAQRPDPERPAQQPDLPGDGRKKNPHGGPAGPTSRSDPRSAQGGNRPRDPAQPASGSPCPQPRMPEMAETTREDPNALQGIPVPLDTGAHANLITDANLKLVNKFPKIKKSKCRSTDYNGNVQCYSFGIRFITYPVVDGKKDIIIFAGVGPTEAALALLVAANAGSCHRRKQRQHRLEVATHVQGAPAHPEDLATHQANEGLRLVIQ